MLNFSRERNVATKTASELFIEGITQIARGLRDRQRDKSGDRNDDDQISTIASALMKKQADHEERKRRISQTIANGSRISRNL
jgi:uncharacterized protein (UPF0305 family)